MLASRPFSVLHNRFARDFLLTAGGNIVIAATGAIGGILAARLLGPVGRGELAAAIVWAGILGILVQLGMPQAITYFTARYTEQVGAILQATLLLLVLQSILILTVGTLVAQLVMSRLQPEAAFEVRLYLWSIPATTLTTYLGTIAQGMRRFDLFGLLRIVASFIYVIALTIAFALNIREAAGVLALMLAGQIVVAVAALVFFLWRLIVLERSSSSIWVRQLVAYGLRSYIGSLAWMANARLDQFVMSFAIALGQLGIYAVAVSYAGVLYPVLAAFANVLFPHVAGAERDRAASDIMKVLGLTILAASLGALVLGVASKVLVPGLFGQDFASASTVAVVLLAGTVFLGCNYVLSDALRGLGHPLVPSMAEVFGLLITIGGLWLLLPRLGIMGAAWTSVFSYAAVFGVLLVAVRRILGLSVSRPNSQRNNLV